MFGWSNYYPPWSPQRWPCDTALANRISKKVNWMGFPRSLLFFWVNSFYSFSLYFFRQRKLQALKWGTWEENQVIMEILDIARLRNHHYLSTLRLLIMGKQINLYSNYYYLHVLLLWAEAFLTDTAGAMLWPWSHSWWLLFIPPWLCPHFHQAISSSVMGN